MRKIVLYGLLFISIIGIIWLYFFENIRIPVYGSINPINVNKLLETLFCAYVTSFIFYWIVIQLKEKEDKKIIYPFVADYVYVLMNNCIIFSNTMRDWAGVEKIISETSIYDRNLDIYPNSKELKIICKNIDPNREINLDIGLHGFKTIPHFYGIMIKYSIEIDYFLKIILEKSNYIDIELLRILTDIRTSGYHKDITSYGKESIFIAKHRHSDLIVYETSFQHYFELFVKLEKYAEKNLKKYVERKSLKTKTQIVN